MKKAIFLPVKGMSERIKSKNLKMMDGKPLFLHTLEKICQMNFFDEVWLDTDSEEIINLSSYLDCSILRREPNLSTNRTDGNKLFLNELKYTDADIVTQILCTSPFISTDTIKLSVEQLIKNNDYDSSVLVKKQRQYTWSGMNPNYNIDNIPNSVDLPDTVIETMGLYTVWAEVARKVKRRIGDRPILINVSAVEAVDVNHKDDFELASLIASGIREQRKNKLRKIRSHISSAILSDIIDDLQISEELFVRGLMPNLEGAKLFGRAKTLHLRRLEKGEDFKGIYNALDSYASIVPGDIIVVQNDAGEWAYFGELNANLAIRAGAEGAIICGYTRDYESVRMLNFPTFAKGYTGKDVRRKATTESINKTIEINGVSVSPGNLIFADKEGVVVIPNKYEHVILSAVMQKLNTEKNIIIEIANDQDTKDIVDSYGEF